MTESIQIRAGEKPYDTATRIVQFVTPVDKCAESCGFKSQTRPQTRVCCVSAQHLSLFRRLHSYAVSLLPPENLRGMKKSLNKTGCREEGAQWLVLWCQHYLSPG